MVRLGNISYGAQIASAAAAHNLDPRLLAAVAAQETGGPGSSSGRNIVGDGGHGRGLFQIDDRSWAFAKTPAAMDPAANADMAASILSDNLKRYGGNVHAALSAYNAGSPNAVGTTTTWADGSTLGYADSVLRHESELGGDPELAAQTAVDSAYERYAGGSGLAVSPSLAAASAPALADPSLGASLSSPIGSGQAGSTSGFTPLRSWTSLTQAAGTSDPGADADGMLSSIIGASMDSGDDGDDD